MTKEVTCCFTGPRPKNLPQNGDENSPEIAKLKEKLFSAAKDAYLDGYRFFISGMAEGFDLFAAEEVIKLKEKHPEVNLICAFPCPSSRESRGGDLKTRTENIIRSAAAVVYVQNSYSTGCEHLRNIYMADNSFRIIGFFNGLSGGTAHCWNYAAAQGLEMINLYE